MPAPLVFIPPSETKREGGEPSFLQGHGKYRSLASRRDRVFTALERAMKGTVESRSKLLKVKGTALDAATELNLKARAASVTRPAMERYTGVLYDALDWTTLDERARRTLSDHVAVVDGLYGLLAPSDEIADYKLPIDATLPELGKLAEFWRDPIRLELDELEGHRELWDMLPEAHRKAMPKEIPFQLTIDFMEVTGDQAKLAGHANKAPKGALLRHMAQHGFSREVAEKFAHDGFTFDTSRSGPDKLVFSRVIEAPAPEPAPPPAKPAKRKAAKKANAAAPKKPAKAKAVKKAVKKKARPAKVAAKKTAKKKTAKKAAKKKGRK